MLLPGFGYASASLQQHSEERRHYQFPNPNLHNAWYRKSEPANSFSVFNAQLRLWRVQTGKELIARSPTCNYFSFPAAFSPDENTLACIDGEQMRIWDLNTGSPSLLQSIPLQRSTKKARNVTWNGIMWADPSTLLVSNRSDRDFSYQGIRRPTSTDFSQTAVTTLIRGGRSNDGGIEFNIKDAIVSPDGRFLLVAASVDRQRGVPDGMTAVFVRDFWTNRQLATLKVPNGDFLLRHFAMPHQRDVARPRRDDPSDEEPSCFLFSPDASMLAISLSVFSISGLNVANEGPLVELWSTTSWQKLATLSAVEAPGSGATLRDFNPCCFSPDSKWIAGTATREAESPQTFVILWDTATGKQSQVIDLGSKKRNCLPRQAGSGCGRGRQRASTRKSNVGARRWAQVRSMLIRTA